MSSQPESLAPTRNQDERLYHRHESAKYLGDGIYGGIDGVVTTFAVVAGSLGASLAPHIILILGFANLIADGISMGIGNYLGKKSDQVYNQGQRQREMWEIENKHDEEMAETRAILVDQGYKGTDLDQALNVITANKERWANWMLREELGIYDDPDQNPAKHGTATFIAFVIAGLVPLLAFMVPGLGVWAFYISMVLTGLTLFGMGAARARVSPVSWWRGGLEIFGVGSIAAVAAYVVGAVVEQLIR